MFTAYSFPYFGVLYDRTPTHFKASLCLHAVKSEGNMYPKINMFQLRVFGIKTDCTNFTHEVKCACPREYYLACGNSCIVSSVVLEEFSKAWENKSDDIIEVYFMFGTGFKHFKRKPVLQN